MAKRNEPVSEAKEPVSEIATLRAAAIEMLDADDALTINLSIGKKDGVRTAEKVEKWLKAKERLRNLVESGDENRAGSLGEGRG